jgi:hypothetical protein
MENTGQMNPQEIRIQGLLDRYLATRADRYTADTSAHLDQDSLAAFVEGNLSRREAGPVISHLVDCSFCRHITAELVRLDLEFEGETIERPIVSEEPSKISAVLNGLLSRIFGTADGAVFAHQESEEEEKEPEDSTDDDTKE